MSQESELSLCRSTTSISDIIGGLSSFMLNYFKMKFPEGMFNETYIANSLNANILARNINHNQKLPFIGMEVSYEGEESSMGQLPLHHTGQYYIAKQHRHRYYRTIFQDEDNNITIYAIPDRLKVKFNFMLKFQTQMKAIDMMYYIKSNFELNGMNYVNGIRLPVDIPRYFVNRIRDKHGLKAYDKEDNDKLRNYFRSFSADGIHEVVNQSTGNKEFRYEYVTNVLLSYPQEATHENNELNLVIKDAAVNFSIDAEVWVPSGFILELNDKDLLPIPPKDEISGMSYTFDLITIRDRIPKRLENGFYMIDNRRFISETNDSVDLLEMESILSKDIKNVIEYIAGKDKYKGMVEKVFQYRLYANDKYVMENMYEVDYLKHTLTVNNPDPNVTYTIVLYGNIVRLNEINDLIYANKRYKIHKVMDDILEKGQ